MKKITVEKVLFLVSFFFFIIFCFSFFAHIVSAFTFTRNLTIGSTGEDVRQLQVFLNSYSNETRVANSGVGSVGNETTYFGQLTQNALIRFQNLFAQQILIPVGLTSGTGYLGPSTRNFINSFSNLNLTIGNNTPILNTSPESVETETDIQSNTSTYTDFLFIAKTAVKNGEKVYVGSQSKISGLEFTIDNNKLDKKCPSDNMCELQIESQTPGKKMILTSNSTISPTEINILDDNELSPSVKIPKITLNKDNLIKGKNFTETIKIYTLFGIYESKTKDDSFVLNIQTSMFELSDYLKSGPFYIENSNGLISDIIIVNYEI